MDLPATFGKYELLERIATGGMAEVYLARSFGIAGFEKRLVVKRIRPELADDPRFVQMFINEAKIGVHLNHPNVVQVYELGRVGGTYYIAMEHLHGKDLTRLVKTLRAEGRKLPLPIACWIVAEACRGLAYAHTRVGPDGEVLGLVHQDVSPHNLLVTFDGDVKLVDFGIARLVNTAESSRNQANDDARRRPGGGKYAYMSPEQATGQSIDHRTDVFSAGIVLWELIVGHRLFQHPDPIEKLRMVQEARIHDPREEGVVFDDALWAILQRALARDRHQRYPTATQLEEDLRAWLFENRHRVGRTEVAEWIADAFPGVVDSGLLAFNLARMVADVERLESRDNTATHLTPSGRTGSGSTPLPGRLPVSAGERKPVTILLIDVDGLTDLSARLEPEKLFVRHYQLLRWCRRIVDRYGGRIQATVDDQITVMFGVPRTRTDDVVHAIECAMELQRRVGELRRLGMSLELAIGAHMGEVTVGRGPSHKVRYVARGNTTRLARRLSAVADHGEILVSERVMEQGEGAFLLGAGPAIPCRGGREPLPSLRVEGRRSGLRIASRGPWIRRDNELEVLRDGLVALTRGEGAAVVLAGGIGTGKTRLVREINDLAHRRGIPFYAARCPPRQARNPLAVFGALIRQILGINADLSQTAMHAHVERLSQLGLSPRDLDAIGVLLGLPVRHAPDATETWGALDRTFHGLAREGPCILALDDVHELDAASLEGLARLIEDHHGPALWLLAARDQSPPPLADHATRVTLPPLEDKARTRLIESLLAVDDADRSLFALVSRTCEGNPLYIEEMLKYLLEQGRIVLEDGFARLLQPETGAELPQTLAALIGARIDALDAAAKGALQLAAVMGTSFETILLAEAAGLEDPSPLVAELASHGLITRGGQGEWRFTSELVQEAALRGVMGAQRRDYHRMVAAALETRHADELSPYHEALARHCKHAGRAIDAARYAYSAGQALEQKQAFDRARGMYEHGLRAMATAERTPDTYDARIQGEASLNVRLGIVCMSLGDLAAGHRALQIALDISADSGLPWVEVRAHLQLGRGYLERARFALASAHLGQARALLRIERDPELEQQALEATAVLAFEEGRNADAESLWQQALANAADDPAARARCEIGLANRYLRVGRYEEAAPLLDRALDASREIGDRILEGRVLNNIGLLHSWAGRHEEALAFYRRALEVREGIGYLRGVVVNHHNVGDTHFKLGDWARAYVAFNRSRDLAEEMGWDRGVILNDVYMAYISASQGQSDVDGILDATHRARSLGDAEITTAGSWLAGRYLAEQGRREEARTQLDRALDDARRWDLRPMVEVIQSTAASLA